MRTADFCDKTGRKSTPLNEKTPPRAHLETAAATPEKGRRDFTKPLSPSSAKPTEGRPALSPLVPRGEREMAAVSGCAVPPPREFLSPSLTTRSLTTPLELGV